MILLDAVKKYVILYVFKDVVSSVAFTDGEQQLTRQTHDL